MNISLNISERLYTLALLNQFKGSLEILLDILEDIKKIRITDEDWIKAERQIIPSKDEQGKESVSWVWNDDKGGEKEIELTKESKKYLLEKINDLNTKGEFTIQDKAAITLKEKLESKMTLKEALNKK